MKKIICPLPLSFLTLLLGILYAPFVSAQDTLWREQAPWEGVPEYYRKWNYPDFSFPANLNAWNKERPKIQDTLKMLLGDIPPRPKQLKVQTVYKKQLNGYTLEKLLIDNEVDGWIPALLAIPTNVKGKVPVVLSLHGSSNNKDNIFGLFGVGAYTSQNVLAVLIPQGFALMAIDSHYNGDRRGTGPAGERERQSHSLDQEESQWKIHTWFGRTLWGMQLRDEQIALDYLASRSEIDSSRIGAQGMSMGSTHSWWLAALDNRIKAVVGVACFTHYKELIAQRELKAHDLGYFVPGMLKHFDTEAVMGLIAPRPFLALTGDSDIGSPPSGMKVLEKKLDAVYSLFNQRDRFKSIIYPQTGHVYTDEMKIEMLAWFQKYLK